MSAREALPLSIRPARAGEIRPGNADVAHALLTDPDGAFVAVDSAGRLAGFAVAAVREDTLLLVDLEVESVDRAKGAGRALLAAVRAHGAALRAAFVEAVVPADPATLAFFLRGGLTVRSLLLDHERAAAPPPRAQGGTLHSLGLGTPLTGWVADLDRETRGFARPRDWARSMAGGEVVSLKRGGRPQALGAIEEPARGVAAIGPIAAKSPEAAVELLAHLVARSRARVLTLTIPAENRGLLIAAAACGFRPAGARVLVASRRRGDFRRYGGGSGRFF